MTKCRNKTVAHETVERPSVFEQSAVVPPSLVATVHLQKLLVLTQLEFHPLAVWAPPAVQSGERVLGLFPLSSSVVPAGRLGEEHRAEQDDAWEHQLEANRNHPGRVSSVVETATGSPCGDEGTNGPHDVVETGNNSTEGRVGHFDDIHGTSGSGDGDTETEEEATRHELGDAGIYDTDSLDDDTEDDDEGSDKHANATAPGINGWTNEGNGTHAADLVDGRDKTCIWKMMH